MTLEMAQAGFEGPVMVMYTALTRYTVCARGLVRVRRAPFLLVRDARSNTFFFSFISSVVVVCVFYSAPRTPAGLAGWVS